MAGWLPIGRIGDVPIRIHFSAFLGALFFSGFRFAPGAWLGFLVVILVHELGHALIVKKTRKELLGVDIHAIGGECRWAGRATPLERALIAWGGVWAQLALLVIALPLYYLVAARLGSFGIQFFYALSFQSLILAAINLLPIPPLDGAEAWKLPGLLFERYKKRRSPGFRA
ncbi:MAG: hypothetical protein HOW73_33445 [Polyangiaceae bacterium]|nr:hypothetical protein [Polyangiaceae bacterium]